jgi:hypothetical protein
MMNLLLSLAIVLVLAVCGVKLFQQWRLERARPGRSQASAIPIENYADIDVTVRLQSCPCGGRYAIRGEGPVTGTARPLRTTHLECRRCNRERVLYFDLTNLKH